MYVCGYYFTDNKKPNTMIFSFKYISYFRQGSILFSQQNWFFCSAKFRRVAKHCEGRWVSYYPLIIGACCVPRESEVHKTTTMAPSSAVEQRACTALPLSLNPWCRGVEINPSSVTRSQPEGCIPYCRNSTVDLYCWWLIDLTSYSFFHSWTFTWRPVLPLLMKNLQSVSKQPVDVTRKL